MKTGFREMLKVRQEKVGSLLCVGLDPLPEKVPEVITDSSEWKRVLKHMSVIVDATAPYASMFKPQSAYYEAIENGRSLLQTLVEYIKWKYPDIPVFLDCKRGDIDRTQERYGYAHLVGDSVDGMNYNPYMGNDCMKQLLRPNLMATAGIVGLGRTSNPSAWQIQDAPISIPGYYRMWEYVVHCIWKWAEEFGGLINAGVVMGAAHPAELLKKCIHYAEEQEEGRFVGIYSHHLKRARELAGNDLWFLIPGVGKQGGAVLETVRASFAGYGSIAINSSSGINFASAGRDFAEAAAKEAKRTRDEINSSLG